MLAATVQIGTRNVFQQILAYARGLILPNLLGPAHYGVVATVLLVERYATYTNLGIHLATLYDVPALLARGRADEVSRIHRTAWSFTFLTGGLTAVVIWGIVWWRGASLPEALVAPLLVAALLPLLLTLRGVLTLWLRITGQFALLARAGMVGAVITLLLTVGGGLLWASTGVIIGLIVGYALLIAYFIREAPPGGFALQPRLVFRMLQFSIPVHVCLGVLLQYLSTADRIAVLRLFDIADVGYYAIGQTLASVLMLIPGAVGETVAPDIVASAQDLTRRPTSILLKTTVLLAGISALLLAALTAALPSLLPAILPQYQAAIILGQLLCLAAYFDAVATGAHHVIVSKKKVGTYIALAALLVPVATVTLVLAGRAGGVRGIAIATIPLVAARALWVVWMGGRLSGMSPGASIRSVLSLTTIGVIGWTVGWAVALVFPGSLPSASVPALLVAAALKGVLACVVVGCWLGVAGHWLGLDRQLLWSTALRCLRIARRR